MDTKPMTAQVGRRSRVVVIGAGFGGLSVAKGLARSDWETDKDARDNARPRRRYYELTATGKAQLADADSRYRAVSKLFPKRGRV